MPHEFEDEIEKKLPPELLLVGVQNFPFKGRNVLNFFLQGVVVLSGSAVIGFLLGHSITILCR